MRGLVALALAAGPVWAECPVRADLAQGIRFTLDTGETEVFTALTPHVVQSLFFYTQTDALRWLAGKGLYVLEAVDMENGVVMGDTRTAYAFDRHVADLPDPVPMRSERFDVTRVEYGAMQREQQVYDFGAPEQVVFADCTYEMMPVTVTYETEDERVVEVNNYLTALGLSYLVSSEYDGATETYTYVAIEVVE